MPAFVCTTKVSIYGGTFFAYKHASGEPLFEATEVIYEAIDKRINELVAATKYNCKYVILMGAILINSDSDMGSYTSAKRFDVIELATGERKNLLLEI